MKKLLLNLGMLLMSAPAFSQVLYDNGIAAGGSGIGGMVTTGSTGSIVKLSQITGQVLTIISLA